MSLSFESRESTCEALGIHEPCMGESVERSEPHVRRRPSPDIDDRPFRGGHHDTFDGAQVVSDEAARVTLETRTPHGCASGRHQALQPRRLRVTARRPEVHAVQPGRRLAAHRRAARQHEANSCRSASDVIQQVGREVDLPADPHHPPRRLEPIKTASADACPGRVGSQEGTAGQQRTDTHRRSIHARSPSGLAGPGGWGRSAHGRGCEHVLHDHHPGVGMFCMITTLGWACST